MSTKLFGCFVLAATIASTLNAESRCPGNVSSLPYRVVNRHQMIVPVSIHHSGPFSFLLDTGTQMTTVDPALAEALHLETTGKAAVASVGVQASASFAQAGLIEVGSHSVANLKVLVYDLANLQTTGLNIQGVLGEDFLKQFDMLIDNAHGLVCLDDSGAMRAEVKGAHVALLSPAHSTDETPIAESLIRARVEFQPHRPHTVRELCRHESSSTTRNTSQSWTHGRNAYRRRHAAVRWSV